MARQSVFDEQFTELLTRTGEGLTTRQMAEAVGSSAQKAFVWVREHKGELVEMGKDENGGTVYVGVGNVLAVGGKPAGKTTKATKKAGVTGVTRQPVAKSNGTAPAPPSNGHASPVMPQVYPVRNGDVLRGGIEVGINATLVRLALDGGAVLVTWETADGRTYTGTLNV